MPGESNGLVPPSPDVHGDGHLKSREHDQGGLDLDDKPRVEGSPLSRISARVGDHPALTDSVIDFIMDVTMHPQCRLPFDDQVLQIGGVAGRLELRWN